MEPTCSPNQSADEEQSAKSSRRHRRQEKRQKRLEDTRLALIAKPYSNYRLPVSVPSTDVNLLLLSRYDALADRDRHPPLFVVPDQKSQWARLRMVLCPVHGCSCSLDPNGWLAHYLNVHLPKLGMSFVGVPLPTEKQTLHATCHIDSLEYDVNTLLGVYGYHRLGLNPLNCPRNTLLPREYRKYSQHGVLMLFACRTRHSLLWQRKQMDDVIAIWVSTPLQGVSISLRCVVQSAQSTRYYSKCIKARPLPTAVVQASPCRDFIKTDSNVIVISYQDLWQLKSLNAGQQLLHVVLHVTGEQKI
ncbi:uncharacterized protein LOC117779826 [Drosophila innubila]|uniref:uncharacterized protein LOC117779826 n=1 Tax=Drosophila innubila TaxID=198719 RepID=UPI00148DEF17|nr:uncharacterized protein LOC117779826 [Drosophila innubila]